jgi:hypothetical protein
MIGASRDSYHQEPSPMSPRTKSKSKRMRHQNDMKWKRRLDRKKAALLAEGKIKKGTAPVAAAQ